MMLLYLLCCSFLAINGAKLVFDDCPISSVGNVTIGGSLTIEQDEIGFFEYTEHMIAAYQMFHEWLHYERAGHKGMKINGEIYCLILSFEEDHADPAFVTSVYQQQIANDSIDVFIGPFSSYLASYAIDVTESSDRFLLAPAASSSSLFKNKDATFSMQSPASLTFAPILRELYYSGARTVSYAYQDSSGNSEACLAIEGLIEDNYLYGMTVLESFVIQDDDNDGTTNFFNSTQAPDIFIGCMYYDKCISTLDTMRSVVYEPDSIVLTSCASVPEFIDEATSNGVYTLTDVFWTPDFVRTDPITNWTIDEFSDRFKAIADDDVSEIAAAAFSALEVLLYAIEGANSTDSRDLVIELQRMRLESVYGQIEFDSNNMNTIELAYLQINTDQELCIVSPSDVKTCPMVYPMITWSQQECIAEYGNSSCRCGVKACEPCAESDVIKTVSDCGDDDEGIASYEIRDLDECYADATSAVSLPNSQSVDCGSISSSSAAGIAIIFFTCLVLMIAMTCLVWILKHRMSKIVLANQPKMLSVLSAGVLIFLSQCFTYIGAPSTLSCSIQVIMFSIGFTMVVGSVLLVAYRVWRVFGNDKLLKIKIREKDLFKGLFGMLMLDALIILFMLVLYQPTAITEQVSGLNEVPVVVESYCLHQTSMVNATCLYKLAQACVAWYLSYRTRNVDKRFLQSDLAAISTSIMTSCVYMCYFDLPIDAHVLPLFRCCYIILSSFLCLTVMVGPKIALFGENTKKMAKKKRLDSADDSSRSQSVSSTSNLLNSKVHVVGSSDFSLLNQEMAAMGPRDTLTAVGMLNEEADADKNDHHQVKVQTINSSEGLDVIREKKNEDDDEEEEDSRRPSMAMSPSDLLELPYKVKKLETENKELSSQLRHARNQISNMRREIDGLRIAALSAGRLSMDRFSMSSASSSSSSGSAHGSGWNFFHKSSLDEQA